MDANTTRRIDTPTLQLADGDTLDLEVAPVTTQVDGVTVRMLAYNGAIPGPTVRVRQNSTITVRVKNRGDLETTVHWHGLRLDNRFDGTHLTQAPIPVDGEFTYELQFPDAGAYWYHPHIREDYGQELGLYGNIVVEPADADYWPAVHREVTLTLDDILIENGAIAPLSKTIPDHVAMGRFGNVMFVAGGRRKPFAVKRGEVVRFYVTNTANTRIFNVAVPGARMKLVGSDSGRYERERIVDEVLIAPSERVVVDVLFDRPGELTLEHRTPKDARPLARISVSEEIAEPTLADHFDVMREFADLVETRRRIAPHLDAAPDKTLVFMAKMDHGRDRAHIHHGHGQAGHGSHGSPTAPPKQIEWEDDMAEMNRTSTPANMHWKLVDRATGRVNGEVDWRFKVGDRVKIRLENALDSDHPMPHPFHIHGAGRFLVLARDGVTEPNLAWKDTVLVQTGEVVDILLEVTHAGTWMAHCHIAEHHESGMMLAFTVDP